MAKKATVQTESKAGVQWREVKGSNLSPESQRLYQQYVSTFQKANALGATLKETVQREWHTENPNGVNGKVCAFNAIGGVLLYVMKDKEKPKKATKQLDMNQGDDVFSRPQ